MENFEYNKIFPAKKKEDDLNAEELEKIENCLSDYQEKLHSRPKYILPRAPSVFSDLTARWERIAEEFSGRIRAKIDYSDYAATIEVWCSYVEFETKEFLDTLHHTSQYVLSLAFTPLTSGELHIESQMPYFMPTLE